MLISHLECAGRSREKWEEQRLRLTVRLLKALLPDDVALTRPTTTWETSPLSSTRSRLPSSAAGGAAGAAPPAAAACGAVCGRSTRRFRMVDRPKSHAQMSPSFEARDACDGVNAGRGCS